MGEPAEACHPYMGNITLKVWRVTTNWYLLNDVITCGFLFTVYNIEV